MEKLPALQQYLQERGRVLVAFSGGVDSALLAFLSRRTLGRDQMLAVTGDSATVPSEDRHFVTDFCRQYDIPHRFISTYEYENPNYRANPENRCFFCKEELYRRLQFLAQQGNWPSVLDGTNTDDLKGHRPGYQALQEAGIRTPYLELGIDKEAIRSMAAHFRLEVAHKPQSACLASRIPTGTPIDLQSLQQIDAAENFLRQLGLQQVRVRHHGDIARLEVGPDERTLCLEFHRRIVARLREIGFRHVTLDLQGYSRG